MKGRIAFACAALLASACSSAQDQDQVVFMPMQPRAEGMAKQECYAAAPSADGAQLQLKLENRHSAKWIRLAGTQRTGEAFSIWQPAGDAMSLENYGTSPGMPALPAKLTKQDGNIVADGIGTLSPAACWSLDTMPYDMPMATLQMPEGMESTGREDRDFGTGKPGVYVTIEAPEQEGFLGLVSFTYAAADAPPMDLRAEAVHAGNPFDPALTADAAVEQTIGGLPGAKYSGSMTAAGITNHFVGYAIDYHGCRMTVQLQGDDASEAVMRQLSAAVEAIEWKPDAKCAPPASS